MTMTNLTEWIGKIARVTTTVGTQAWHYQGKIISVSDTHITIEDFKEGLVEIPISTAMIREVRND